MTSTPVAIGSSVPAWPIRRVPAMRRIRATTSCDVMPAGLSTITRPEDVIADPIPRERSSLLAQHGPAAAARAPDHPDEAHTDERGEACPYATDAPVPVQGGEVERRERPDGGHQRDRPHEPDV